MSILGLDQKGPTEVSIGFRRGWFRHVKIALASAGWIAVIVAVIQLFSREPNEGFGLLARWGPWPIVALVAIVFGGLFLSRLNDTIQMSFGHVVDQATRTADALTKLADQGGRQAEEVRRLAVYAAQEFPGIYGRLDKQDRVLGDTLDAVLAIKEKLARRVAG